MREICHELSLPWPPEATFALLHTPSAVREWWSAARVIVVPGPSGLWTAAWGDDEDRPEYVTAARILSWEPPWRLRLGDFQYHTREGVGLPFEAALETDFTVRPAPGGCVLQVRQTGFPDPPNGDAFYRACQSGWEATLDGIRRFVQRRARSTTEGSQGGA